MKEFGSEENFDVDLLNISQTNVDIVRNYDEEYFENEKLKDYLIDSAKKFNLNYNYIIKDDKKENENKTNNIFYESEDDDITKYNEINFQIIEKIFSIISIISNK